MTDDVEEGRTVWFDRGHGPEKGQVWATGHGIAISIGRGAERTVLAPADVFPSKLAVLERYPWAVYDGQTGEVWNTYGTREVAQAAAVDLGAGYEARPNVGAADVEEPETVVTEFRERSRALVGARYEFDPGETPVTCAVCGYHGVADADPEVVNADAWDTDAALVCATCDGQEER